MINFAELDLRIAAHATDMARRNLPAWQDSTAQRALVPGALATKFRSLTARFAPHGRQGAARSATTGPVHS